MRCQVFILAVGLCLAGLALAQEVPIEEEQTRLEDLEESTAGESTQSEDLVRPKRTLLLKKKLLGLGALGLGVGFGVGAIKGYVKKQLAVDFFTTILMKS